MEFTHSRAEAEEPVPWRRIALFFGLAMLLTHSGMALYLLRGGATDTMGASGFGAVFMRWCPGLLALIFQRLVNRDSLRSLLSLDVRPNRWFVAAWLWPVLWFLLILGLTLAVPGTRYTPDLSGLREHFAGTTEAELAQARAQVSSLPLPAVVVLPLAALLIGPTLSTLAAMGEEIAWRGYLLRALRPLGFLRAMLLAALMQYIWHLPFLYEGFMYPGHALYGSSAMLAWIGLMSFVTTYVTVRARSVWAAAIFHGVSGASGPITAALYAGGNYYLVGETGVLGLAALLPFAIACWVHDRFISKSPMLGGQG